MKWQWQHRMHKIKIQWPFFLNPGRIRIVDVDEAASQINLHAHIDFYIITNPIEDFWLLFSVTNNINVDRIIKNNNITPRESTIRIFLN